MRADSVLVALLLLASPLAAQDYKGFVEKHCLECHDAETKKGNLDLSKLSADFSTRPAMDRWTAIIDRVTAGEMPPAKRMPRPTADELRAFTAWVRPRLIAADRTRREVVQRRLNRVEFDNTMRDLLGIDIDLKPLLPEDQRMGGFDNNGEALAVSAELLGSYLEAASKALNAAIVHGPKPEEKSVTASLEKDVQAYLKSYSFIDGRTFIYWSEEGGYSKLASREKRAPSRGIYRLSFEAVTRNTDKPITFSVNASDFAPVSATARTIGYYDATATVRKFEIETLLERGQAIQFFAQTLPRWVHNEPAVVGTFAGIGWGPVTMTGPINATWPPPGHQALLGDVDLAKGTIDDAERILRRFMPRAFRRPVTDDEVARYLKLVRSRLDKGRSFEASLRAGLEGVLCSPNFLYLREDVRPGDRINDYELASRLSYFLWSTMPDAELLDLASKDKLHEPATLAAQTARLIADPRSARFVEHFTGQWLLLRNIDATTPDKKLYPTFDELLKISMVQESHGFFRELLSKDLNLVNFLDSDFAMLNRRLAAHYGVPGVDTLDVQPVKLPEGCVRGGVMTQGAVLKVTANGTNTSPVLRGVWVLENVLGRHIPPPPPNITGIEPDIRGALTIREQLDKHRNVPMCNQCHQHIDPPGFALESFDPVGRFRTKYAKWVAPPPPANPDWGKLADGAVVDPAGKTSTGQPFAGIAEFKTLLLEHHKEFAHCLAEKLLTYGLGREIGYSDRDDIDAIVTRTSASGNGLRTLIVQIVQSPLFSRR